MARWPKTIASHQTIAAPVSALDLFPTIASLTKAALPTDRVFDGQDLSKLLLEGQSSLQPRVLCHYFGPQLQAVREDKWKLFLPIDHLPEKRLASLWFTHQPELFARQHRLWPEPTLYDLSADAGETTNVATQHPDIVHRLLETATQFERTFQLGIRELESIPHSPPPAPGDLKPPALSPK